LCRPAVGDVAVATTVVIVTTATADVGFTTAVVVVTTAVVVVGVTAVDGVATAANVVVTTAADVGVTAAVVVVTTAVAVVLSGRVVEQKAVAVPPLGRKGLGARPKSNKLLTFYLQF
jgi:hypothetical protein